MRWEKHVARMEGAINTYRVLVGKSTGKRPRGRRRQCWDGNINPLAPEFPFKF